MVKALSSAESSTLRYTPLVLKIETPSLEVSGLMDLLMLTLKRELKGFMKEGFILRTIGDIEQLPTATRDAVKEVVHQTKDNGMVINVALSYGGRWKRSNCKVMIDKALNHQLDGKH